jgi:hypothetical protein
LAAHQPRTASDEELDEWALIIPSFRDAPKARARNP